MCPGMGEELKIELICIKLHEIGNEGWKHKLQWGSSARRKLAAFFNLLELNELVADITVLKSVREQDVFILKGSFQASFVQECAICLGPLCSSVREDVVAKFVPSGLDVAKEDIFTYLDEDYPETYSGEILEVGKFIQDQLSLAIEPYPRHEESQCAALGAGANYAGVACQNLPFSNLGKLLDRNKKNTNE